MSGSLLLVDDEPNIIQALGRVLHADGYTIYRAGSGQEGLELLAQHAIDVIVSDQRMPGMQGSEFLAIVQNHYPETVRVLLSGYSDFQSVVSAINHGAIYKFWSKPWDDHVLRQQMREAFVESRRLQLDSQHNQMLDVAIEGVVMVDTKGVVVSANPSVKTITGFSPEELVGCNFFQDCVGVEHQGIQEEIIHAVESDGEWKGQLCGCRKDASRFIQQLSVNGFRDPQGSLSHLGILLLDVTEKKELELNAELLRHYDDVTGLPNRRLLLDRLVQILKFSQSDTWITVISLTIQRFSSLIEHIGCRQGEQVLKQAGERIQALLPEDMTLACGGVDSFVILATIDQHTAERLVLSLLQDFEQALHYESNELYLRFTMGLVSVDAGTEGVDAEMLLQQADTAKLQAGLAGHSYSIYEADRNSGLRERWVLEHALPKALANNELRVVYQPKLDVSTGTIQGMEALLRWKHAKLGHISPETFIAIAEETGHIVELGKWCLYTACEQAKRWQSQGFDSLRLAVNLSACQMRSPHLYDMIESTLISLDYPPHLLELEITESALVDDESVALDLMRRLRSLGIRLAADDFGTGYASIDYLKRFPFSTLKIDRSFIADMLNQKSDASILDSIFILAESLRLTVVAEGVENQAQYDFLCGKGCDLIQGYYFSKPLAVDDFTRLLNDVKPQQLSS